MLRGDGVVTITGCCWSEEGVGVIDEAAVMEDQLIIKRIRVDIDVPGINS